MLQQRKKDFLIRLIEEFFKRLQKMTDAEQGMGDSERKAILDDCFDFFFINFGISRTDSANDLVSKIDSFELLEQYAKLLFTESEIKYRNNEELYKALYIIEYIERIDTTFSWERSILKEDLLRLLSESA